MTHRTVHVFESSQSLGGFACDLVAEHARRAIQERGSFTIALSGGSQPQMLAALATEPLRSSIEWHKWYIFWVDERCVPLEHADSNYAQAQRHVLRHVPELSAENVIALDESLAGSPQEAALAYERALRATCKSVDENTGVPQLDLVLLGIGEDGHTASLFPAHALLEYTSTDAVILAITDSPKPPPCRITFSLPLINAARCAAFLATGAGKAEVLAAAFERREPLLPIARVASAHVYWLLDAAAAANVPATEITQPPTSSSSSSSSSSSPSSHSCL